MYGVIKKMGVRYDRILCIMYGVIKKMCVGSLYMVVSSV